MSRPTPDEVLILHATRLLGYADSTRIGARFGMSPEVAEEGLLDAEAHGWVTRSSFADSSGWSLTEAGQQQNERWLAAELDQAGARPAVDEVHRRFLPANAVVAEACTAWQLADLGTAQASVSVPEVVNRLRPTAVLLAELEGMLTTHLRRFAGYHDRYHRAVEQSDIDPTWITAMDRDSCHRVWFEFHEDLVATLGLLR